MTPKIGANVEAIRAISHQFAQRQIAIRWLEWLHRKLSNIWRIGACLLRVVIDQLLDTNWQIDNSTGTIEPMKYNGGGSRRPSSPNEGVE
jgi:hypothetical protein